MYDWANFVDALLALLFIIMVIGDIYVSLFKDSGLSINWFLETLGKNGVTQEKIFAGRRWLVDDP